MSVTTPIFRFDVAGAEADVAGAEADTAGVDAAGVDAAGDDGLGVAPPPQAATMMATAPNSVRPSERLCMCPPQASRLRMAVLSSGPSRASKERSPRRATFGAHRIDVGSVGQVQLAVATGSVTQTTGCAPWTKHRWRTGSVHTARA